MDITIQENTENRVSAVGSQNLLPLGDTVSDAQTQVVPQDPVPQGFPTVRMFRPQRFAIGLLSTTGGAALILGIGFFVVEVRGVGGDFTMPLVGILVLIGVILLGGGFAVMATSSSGFDEEEFDRLAKAGNISAVSQSDSSTRLAEQQEDSL